MFPNNAIAFDAAPPFMWIANRRVDNAFVVDMAMFPGGLFYSSPLISGESNWAMPARIWNLIPSGSYVYWRIRGADLDKPSISIIYSDDIWWFYKP